MGQRHIRTLLDMSIHGFNLKVECRWCTRWRIIDAGKLMWRYHKQGWSIYVEEVHQHLRCAGCGRKDVLISFSEAPESPVQPVRNTQKLTVVRETPCPKGIDPQHWAKANLRERKRMIDNLRG